MNLTNWRGVNHFMYRYGYFEGHLYGLARPGEYFSHMSTILSELRALWPPEFRLVGALIFGSSAREGRPVGSEGAPGPRDLDIGLIFEPGSAGGQPVFPVPENWDVFYWSLTHWRAGFALQLELARGVEIIHDPEGEIAQKLDRLRLEVLPRFESRLRRL